MRREGSVKKKMRKKIGQKHRKNRTNLPKGNMFITMHLRLNKKTRQRERRNCKKKVFKRKNRKVEKIFYAKFFFPFFVLFLFACIYYMFTI